MESIINQQFNLFSLSYEGCLPEFDLMFDDGRVSEVSEGGLAFEQKEISVRNKAAQFGGNSQMKIWGFNNRHFGTNFVIHMRVKPEGECRNRPESLISNCGIMGAPSLEIVCENGKIVFKAETSLQPKMAVISKKFRVRMLLLFMLFVFIK